MSVEEKRRSRGRPKTLDRDHVLEVSMDAYWKEGVEAISLNEICKRANVSKPGIYREFGNDDGLIKAVLIHYEKHVMRQMHQLFTQDKPFREILDQYISILTINSSRQDGCLFLRLRDSKYPLGEESKKQIEIIEEEYTLSYSNWIEKAKNKNEFSSDISTELAAEYIDAQVSMAMTKIFNGISLTTVKDLLTLAFSVFK